MRLIDWIVLIGLMAVGITGLIGVLRSPLTFSEAWTPLSWWLKGLLVLVAITGPLAVLQIVSWGFPMILAAIFLVALGPWANRNPRRSPGRPHGKS